MKKLKRTYIKDLPKVEILKQIPERKIFMIEGFVQTIRDHGKLSFILLRDITGVVQVVVSTQELVKLSKSITRESVVRVLGVVQKPVAKLSSDLVQVELVAQQIDILSKAESLPFSIYPKEDVSVSKRLDYRWLDLRRPEKRKIFEVWTSAEKGFRSFLLQKGFIQIYPPSLMSTASESGAEVFEVKYFKKKAYLAQSPQFYKQMAMAAGFEKVFMVGPVYRAEPSFTTRHMSEFTGWDLEMSFVESYHEIMDFEEELLISIFRQIKEDLGLDIKVSTRPFPRIPLLKVKEIMRKMGVKSQKSDDISPEEERALYSYVKQKFGHDFVFVTDYPVTVRPFYHMRYEDGSGLTKSFDLLYRGIEITTGAQREHRYNVLVKQAKEKGMSLQSLEKYLEFFKYGCPPHGGIGIGPARLIMKLLGLPSVKEVTFLPRDVNRLTP